MIPFNLNRPNNMKHLLSLLLLCFCALAAHAYDFCHDGIYYNTLSDWSIEVTRDDAPNATGYEGDITIPFMVEHESKTAYEDDRNWQKFTIVGDATPMSNPATCITGSCGDNTRFSYNTETGELILSGTGEVTERNQMSYAWSAYNNDIKSITVEEGVTNIPRGAFEWSSVVTLNIAGTVEVIDKRAFSDCTALEAVHLPASVKTVGPFAFSACTALAELTLAEGLEEIGMSAFVGCSSLKSVAFPTTLANIGDFAFSNCKALADISWSEGLRSIGESAFQNNTSLTALTLPATLNNLGNYAFDGCTYIRSVRLPGSLHTLGRSAFQGCRYLADLAIESGLSEIPDYAFNSCPSLKNITLPASITKIGEYAFQNSVYVETFQCFATEPPIISEKAFKKPCTVHVLPGTKHDYERDKVWSLFTIVDDLEPQPDFFTTAEVWRRGTRWEYYDADDNLVKSYELSQLTEVGGTPYMTLVEDDQRVVAYIRTEQGDDHIYARVTNWADGTIYPEVLLYDFSTPFYDSYVMQLGTLRSSGQVGIDEVQIEASDTAPIRNYYDVFNEGDCIAQWRNYIYKVGCLYGPLDYFFNQAADKKADKKNLSHLIFGTKRSTRSNTFFPYFKDGESSIALPLLSPASSSHVYDLQGRPIRQQQQSSSIHLTQGRKVIK